MAVVQSTYPASIPVGYAGMVANGETSNRLSRTVEDVAGIAFGEAAFRGAGDNGVTGTPAAGAFMGIVIADHGIQPLPGGVAADIVPRYTSAALLNEGEIWVIAGSNTTDGAPAFVNAGGDITATSSGGTAIPATFDDTVTSGSLVRLRVVR